MNATHERFVCPDEFNAVDTCSWQFITTTGVISLMAISIFFRNAVVILAATMFKKLLRSVSNLFTLSLAVTDLLLADLVLLLAITNQVLGYWIFWPASLLHLCAISVDRYIAICHPSHYHRLMTKTRSRLICLSLWLLGVIHGIPPIILGKGTESPPGYHFHPKIKLHYHGELSCNWINNCTTHLSHQPVSYKLHYRHNNCFVYYLGCAYCMALFKSLTSWPIA